MNYRDISLTSDEWSGGLQLPYAAPSRVYLVIVQLLSDVSIHYAEVYWQKFVESFNQSYCFAYFFARNSILAPHAPKKPTRLGIVAPPIERTNKYRTEQKHCPMAMRQARVVRCSLPAYTVLGSQNISATPSNFVAPSSVANLTRYEYKLNIPLIKFIPTFEQNMISLCHIVHAQKFIRLYLFLVQLALIALGLVCCLSRSGASSDMCAPEGG
jgi:hypothetical protein